MNASVWCPPFSPERCRRKAIGARRSRRFSTLTEWYVLLELGRPENRPVKRRERRAPIAVRLHRFGCEKASFHFIPNPSVSLQYFRLRSSSLF